MKRAKRTRTGEAGPGGAGPLRRKRLAPASRKAGPPKARGGRVALRIVLTVAMTLAVAALAALYPWLREGSRWFEVEWRYPWLALGLVVVPLAWWWGTLAQDARRPRLRVGTVAGLRGAPRGWRTYLRDLPGVLRSVALALFVLAMTRPVAVLSDQTGEESGIDIILVMDLSGSMQAVLDADPRDLPRDAPRPKNRRLTRLDTSKIVVDDFISRRHTDRIGVVVFGKSAFILSPPTLDYKLLSKQVGKMSLDVIDGTATAMGDALATAAARLNNSDARSKVIILFTDGDSNAGQVSPNLAIDLVTTVGAKTYTIQIGDGDEVDVQRGKDLFGNPVYERRRFPVNPELLHRIATKTGGEHYIATDAKALRQSMHDVLDKLEKTRFEASISSYEDLFALLLLPGVFLVALDALLGAWLLRRFP